MSETRTERFNRLESFISTYLFQKELPAVNLKVNLTKLSFTSTSVLISDYWSSILPEIKLD